MKKIVLYNKVCFPLLGNDDKMVPIITEYMLTTPFCLSRNSGLLSFKTKRKLGYYKMSNLPHKRGASDYY